MSLYIIAPAYNEADGIRAFVARIGEIADQHLYPRHISTVLVVIDDGSADSTFQRIIDCDPSTRPGFSVTALRLSRNFGQQAAFQAGLEYAFRQAGPDSLFVLMDSDLQHPPELIPRIVQCLQSGFDHVQMVRDETASLPLGKRLSSRLFYGLMQRLSGLAMPPGSSDFRGMSYRFLAAYLRFRETGRFNRGLFFWLGFPRCDLPYQAAERQFGTTKYSAGKMLRLAAIALTQFSSKPLVITSSATVILSFGFCALYFLYTAVQFFRGVSFVMGWTSIVFIVSFWSGALALGQLVQSLYVSRLFDEIKSRPLYVVSDVNEAKTQPGDEARTVAAAAPFKNN